MLKFNIGQLFKFGRYGMRVSDNLSETCMWGTHLVITGSPINVCMGHTNSCMVSAFVFELCVLIP